MTYVVAADFRPGSGKWYTHGLELTDDDADANALSDAIAAQSQAFDLYTADHFSPEPGDFPETTTTIDLTGQGGAHLYVPKRIRGIANVWLRNYLGDLTLQDPAVYRVTQSLLSGERQEADLDMISIVPGRYLNQTAFSPSWDWDYPASYTTWPIGVDTVSVEGTFSWATTPEPVKRAVALMVYDTIKPSAPGIHTASEWSTQSARFVLPAPDTNMTGLMEVDRIIGQFTRQRIPAV